MPKWASRASDPRADKADDTMRPMRSKTIGKRIAKHRNGELERFLPDACGENWTQRIDSDFYKALFNSDDQIRQELYWLWEELELIREAFKKLDYSTKNQPSVFSSFKFKSGPFVSSRSPDRPIGKAAY